MRTPFNNRSCAFKNLTLTRIRRTLHEPYAFCEVGTTLLSDFKSIAQSSAARGHRETRLATQSRWRGNLYLAQPSTVRGKRGPHRRAWGAIATTLTKRGVESITARSTLSISESVFGETDSLCVRSCHASLAKQQITKENTRCVRKQINMASR